MKEGKLIVFEGGEKSGKSTQIELLMKRLDAAGVPVIMTKEPGGTEKGQKIREKLLYQELKPAEELSLFLEDRTIHFKEKVLPALADTFWVLIDRCSPSTIAYQHYARGLDLEDIKKRDLMARKARDFDLVFLLDMNPGVALKRAGAETRFEKESLSFHEKVREGFLAQAKDNPEHWVIVDATMSLEQISDLIWKEVQKRFF